MVTATLHRRDEVFIGFREAALVYAFFETVLSRGHQLMLSASLALFVNKRVVHVLGHVVDHWQERGARRLVREILARLRRQRGVFHAHLRCVVHAPRSLVDVTAIHLNASWLRRKRLRHLLHLGNPPLRVRRVDCPLLAR